MEEESLEARCAHLIFHGDDVVGLQWLLQGLTGAELCEFPTKLVPTTDRTFLMACAKQGRPSCCKLILSLDSAASVNYQNAQGYTALHYASYQGHIEVAFLLLAAGADWRILNTHGESAYQTAISGKKFELVNRYQVSPYFADNYYTPVSSVIMSKHDAAQYKLEIINVDSGGDRNLIGLDFHCLAATQRIINTAPANDLSGSAFEASGSIHYGSDDLYIGRARSNHVCMNDLSLSKQHAVICYIENMGFIVYDIGSKHGTFVNKERLCVGTDVYTSKQTTNLHTTPTAESTSADIDVEVKLKDVLPVVVDSMNQVVTANGAACESAVADPPSVAPHTTDVSAFSTATDKTDKNTDKNTETSTGTGTAAVASTDANPVYAPVSVVQPTFLLEGMLVQFGRVHCKVVRKKQEAVLTGRFQPTATIAKSGSDSALHQHHLAVQQRVRALLNVSDEVVVSTTGQALLKSKGVVSASSSGGNVGQKRKVDAVLSAAPTVALKMQSIPAPTSGDLNSSNKGMQLLHKYGWEKGTAIGKSGEKANEPIRVSRVVDRAGIGCSSVGAVNTAVSGSVALIIDEELDSEKTKAWKRMMARFAEPR